MLNIFTLDLNTSARPVMAGIWWGQLPVASGSLGYFCFLFCFLVSYFLSLRCYLFFLVCFIKDAAVEDLVCLCVLCYFFHFPTFF